MYLVLKGIIPLSVSAIPWGACWGFFIIFVILRDVFSANSVFKSVIPSSTSSICLMFQNRVFSPMIFNVWNHYKAARSRSQKTSSYSTTMGRRSWFREFFTDHPLFVVTVKAAQPEEVWANALQDKICIYCTPCLTNNIGAIILQEEQAGAIWHLNETIKLSRMWLYIELYCILY